MPVSQEECRLLAAFGKLDDEKRKIVLAFARLLANGLEPNVTCGACEEHEEIPGKLTEIYCRMFDTIRKRSDFCNVSIRGGRDA